VIEVEDLRKSYAAVQALRGISFEVAAGDVVGFLGPNGAGKTTTLRILTGYMPATEGSVRVAGFDVTSDSRAVRRRVGYLPEDVPLYRDLTVSAFLRYLAGLKDVPARDVRREVERVISLTGLDPVRSRLVGKCSKGFRQRTGLAMALLGNPPVLLLDEPTSGLDPNQVVEVRDLIRELSGEKTVLLSSHILSEVTQICGRVLILHQGRLVASGTPEDLSGRYGPRRRIRVRARKPLDLAALARLPEVESAEEDGEGDAVLQVTDAEAAAPRVARAVLEGGGELLELTPLDSDLEAVFRAVTRTEDDGA
jgi:ABC-2 type transport system ATP-binding protein